MAQIHLLCIEVRFHERLVLFHGQKISIPRLDATGTLCTAAFISVFSRKEELPEEQRSMFGDTEESRAKSMDEEMSSLPTVISGNHLSTVCKSGGRACIDLSYE